NGENGERETAPLELAQDSPDARARTVLVDRLHRHATRRMRRGADDLGKELLRRRIAVQHGALRAFLVVQDELHGDSLAAGPIGGRDVAAVTLQIARI